MRYTLIVILLGGCNAPPLMATIDGEITMIAGHEDVEFDFIEDGPDGATGVFAYYHNDIRKIGIGYRRQPPKLGGSIFVSVWRNGVECRTPVPMPGDYVVDFHSECGSGSVTTPKR